MSEVLMDLSDVTIRAVRTRAGEDPATVVGMIDVLVDRMASLWPGLSWEIPFGGPWSGPVQERQRLVASRLAVDVDGGAVPERGAAFGVTSEGEGLRFHLLVTAGAPVIGERAPLQQASLRVVARGGAEVPREVLDELMAAMVSVWQPVMAVATTRDLALADPVSGWQIPTGQQLWLAVPAPQGAGSETIMVQSAGSGSLFRTAGGVDVGTAVTDMRRVLTGAGLVEISH